MSVQVFVGGGERARSSSPGAVGSDDSDSDITYEGPHPPPRRRARVAQAATDSSPSNGGDASHPIATSTEEDETFTASERNALRLLRERFSSATEEGGEIDVEVSSRPNRWDVTHLGRVVSLLDDGSRMGGEVPHTPWGAKPPTGAYGPRMKLYDGSTLELQSVPGKGVRAYVTHSDGKWDTFGETRFSQGGSAKPFATFRWYS